LTNSWSQVIWHLWHGHDSYDPRSTPLDDDSPLPRGEQRRSRPRRGSGIMMFAERSAFATAGGPVVRGSARVGSGGVDGVQSSASLPTAGHVDIDGACGSRDTAWRVSFTEEGCVRIRDLTTSHTPTAPPGETAASRDCLNTVHGKVRLVQEDDRLIGVLPDSDAISVAPDGGFPEPEFDRRDCW
jgi:hypothetical protein